MTSFVIVSSDAIKKQEYLMLFCNERGIDIFDRTIISQEKSVKQNTQSIGIEDIKHLQKQIFLKPIKSPQKAVIVEEAELLTTEAQNALLKVLEEPPNQTIIVLATTTTEALLPTILSRCQVIQLETEKKELSEDEVGEYENFIERLDTMSIGERLKHAEQLAKDKEKTIEWIENMILVLRNILLQTHAPETAETIRLLQSLHTQLKTTNVNPRMAIENTMLSLV